jgi:hypothetical protein
MTVHPGFCEGVVRLFAENDYKQKNYPYRETSGGILWEM